MFRARIRAALVTAAFLLLPLAGSAQIVNRMQVDHDTFDRYAYGRMQLFNPQNLRLADSLYQVGVNRDDLRYKCLGLSLEFPVRFAQGDYERMDEAVGEIKELLAGIKKFKPFLYATIHEYCQYLIHAGRVSSAMLEARAMERDANEMNNAQGKMYSYRIVGLIQSYRSNSHLAIQNFLNAARYCREARAEQELPNLDIMIAQEFIRQGDFQMAREYCDSAEFYQEYFPTLRIKVLMTRGYLYNAEGDRETLRKCYEAIVANPLYKMQVEANDRYEMDVCYLRSRRLFEQALAVADSISVPRTRHTLKHGIFADRQSWDSAYKELNELMEVKDSIYIKVQNEDLAILDAEMNNAELRAEAIREKARHEAEAERLRQQNRTTILLGFLVMFAIAFFSILISQWQLRENLDDLKKKNNQSVIARQAYQKALDAKEAENAMKVKILQNRKSSTIKL